VARVEPGQKPGSTTARAVLLPSLTSDHQTTPKPRMRLPPKRSAQTPPATWVRRYPLPSEQAVGQRPMQWHMLLPTLLCVPIHQQEMLLVACICCASCEVLM